MNSKQIRGDIEIGICDYEEDRNDAIHEREMIVLREEMTGESVLERRRDRGNRAILDALSMRSAAHRNRLIEIALNASDRDNVRDCSSSRANSMAVDSKGKGASNGTRTRNICVGSAALCH